MWCIPGNLFDLSKGRQRIRELQNQLIDEFETPLNYANILDNMRDFAKLSKEHNPRVAEEKSKPGLFKRSREFVPLPDYNHEFKPVDFYELEGAWADAIMGLPVYMDAEEYGLSGEGLLLGAMFDYFRNTSWDIDGNPVRGFYIGLLRPMAEKNLDVDLLVIGASGIWILESKYYKGRIVLDNGTWYRRKENYEAQRQSNHSNKQAFIDEVLDNPEEQWQRENSAIVEVLERGKFDFQGDLNELVKGGVVFTHPESTIGIDEITEVQVGNIDDWLATIKEYEAGLETYLLSHAQISEAADLILTHSHKFSDGITKSAVDLAEEVYKKTKFDVIMLIDQIKQEFDISTNKELEKMVETGSYLDRLNEEEEKDIN